MKKHGIVKKLFALAAAVIMAFVTISVAAPQTVKAATATVTLKNGVGTKFSVRVGQSKTLSLAVGSKAITTSKYKFTTSNSKIVTVSSKGVVKGIKAGTAKVTVTNKTKSTDKVVITVVVPSTKVTKVTLNKTSLIYTAAGKTYQLKATIAPSKATVKNIIWTSSNTKVAKVSSKGLVTAVGSGTATITAKSLDGGFKATCKVTVKIPVKSVSLNVTSKVLTKIGQTYTLKPTINPSTAYNKTVTWTSSNTKVATVSSTGVVKAIKAGTATITCKTKDGGFKATCKVTVKIPVKSVSLNVTSKELTKIGQTYTLKATIAPTDATDKTVTWTSSNTKVATVSSTGVVKAIKAGTATITCTTKDGGFKATCEVTVRIPVALEIKANDTIKISNYTSTYVYTDEEGIVTVSSKGEISVNPGVIIDGTKEVTITAESEDKTVTEKATFTIVGTTDAVVKTEEGGYKITLDKAAETFDAAYDSLNYAIKVGDVAHDIKTFLSKVDELIDASTPATNLYNKITVENIEESVIVKGNARVTVVEVGNTKTVTVSSQEKVKSIKVTLVSATALDIETEDNTLHATNIKIVSNDAEKVVATATISGEVKTMDVKLTVMKDGSCVALTEVCPDETVIFQYTEEVATYNVLIGGSGYGKLLNVIGSEDKLADTAVKQLKIKNNYNVPFAE